MRKNLGSCPQLYVTRAATLGYQALIGGGFETARRALTERVLSGAVQDPQRATRYLLPSRGPAEPACRVWTAQDGPLLVVAKVEALP